MDSPLDRVKVVELATRWGPLGFLFAKPEKPIFGNDQLAVTRKAADRLAECFNELVDPYRIGGPIERPAAQRFTLQMLVALFAEDIDLLPRYKVSQLLEDCHTKQDSRDLIGGLFEAMNTLEKTPDDRYQDVGYFNGGIFSETARIALKSNEVDLLKAASREDWSKVRPEILGTLFEHSLGKEQRHAYGAHFTHPTDIMKIVSPTIVDPWRKVIDEAGTVKRLRELWQRMQEYTVLDPACGSGNFLYIAYRELKRLEARLFERMAEISGDYNASQKMIGFVSARQFFGLDINPFAVQLAKVTMMIARKLAIDESHITERALPLDNLDDNFKTADALIDESGNPAQWPKTDVIIGNPPFLGAKRLKPERGSDYVNAVRKAYPEVPGMADYCVYWFRKAHDRLPRCTPKDPVAGRAGLVGTQNIRNNQSRVGGLDYIVKTGTIIEAVDNQSWSGEANVHVSLVNWIHSQNRVVVPELRRLWFKSAPTSASKPSRVKENGPAAKQFELDYIDCPSISPSLSDLEDVSGAKVVQSNKGFSFTGQYPRHNGFMLSSSEADSMLKANATNREVVWPFLVGREMLSQDLSDRWVIDFQTRSIHESQFYGEPFAHIQNLTLPYIMEKASAELRKTSKDTGQDQNWLKTWWRHFRPRAELINKLSLKSRYIICSRVTKRPIFVFVSPLIRPGDALSCFVFEDDYSFGILQSNIHWRWFVAKCSKLTERVRYTPESVFDTFPWPQAPNRTRIDAVAEAGRQVRRVRDEALTKLKGGLRAVYRSLELPGKNPLKVAHAALDTAVLSAYGFSAKRDLLVQLLALNLEVSHRENAGEPVTAPGIPLGYPDPNGLVTDDCLRAD